MAERQETSGFMILRHEFQRDCWVLVERRLDVQDAGAAMRALLNRFNPQRGGSGVQPGEYLLVPLEGSARLAIEIQVRDLDAPENPT